MIQYICPRCRTEYRLESREKAGRIRCRVCRTPITTAELDKQEAIKVQINYMIQNQLERPESTPEESSEPATSPVSTARADLYRRRRTRRVRRRFLLPLVLIAFVCIGVTGFVFAKLGGDPLRGLYRNNPPLDSVRLDETIIIEGAMPDYAELSYYEIVHSHRLIPSEFLIVMPDSLKYSVLANFPPKTDTRKLTWKGGPKLARIRGTVQYSNSHTISLKDCVDLSDY